MAEFTSRRPLAADENFIPDSYLLITSGTFQKKPFIVGDSRKTTLLESLDFNCFKWGWRILAYVVMDNHYHLVLQTPPGDRSRLAHIIQSAHSFSAYHWRREDPSIRSRIWWNFWESPLTSRAALLAHINYMHENPRWHGATNAPETYTFSSYPAYLTSAAATIHAWEQEAPFAAVELIDSF